MQPTNLGFARKKWDNPSRLDEPKRKKKGKKNHLTTLMAVVNMYKRMRKLIIY